MICNRSPKVYKQSATTAWDDYLRCEHCSHSWTWDVLALDTQKQTSNGMAVYLSRECVNSSRFRLSFLVYWVVRSHWRVRLSLRLLLLFHEQDEEAEERAWHRLARKTFSMIWFT